MNDRADRLSLFASGVLPVWSVGEILYMELSELPAGNFTRH
jgi:hypothetical protein